MFGWRKRRRRLQHFREVRSQIDEIQTRMVVLVRRELVKHYEALTALQLAQATVDRVFARPAALTGELTPLIQGLSNVLARPREQIRQGRGVRHARGDA
jgi:hypothetical protein